MKKLIRIKKAFIRFSLTYYKDFAHFSIKILGKCRCCGNTIFQKLFIPTLYRVVEEIYGQNEEIILKILFNAYLQKNELTMRLTYDELTSFILNA